MDRGIWQATVHRVAKSHDWATNTSLHTHHLPFLTPYSFLNQIQLGLYLCQSAEMILLKITKDLFLAKFSCPYLAHLLSSNGHSWPLLPSWKYLILSFNTWYLLQCWRPGFDTWVGKIPWRKERLPTPVFWPREFHGLYSPWGRRVGHNWTTLTSSHLSLRSSSSSLASPSVLFSGLSSKCG